MTKTSAIIYHNFLYSEIHNIYACIIVFVRLRKLLKVEREIAQNHYAFYWIRHLCETVGFQTKGITSTKFQRR